MGQRRPWSDGTSRVRWHLRVASVLMVWTLVQVWGHQCRKVSVQVFGNWQRVHFDIGKFRRVSLEMDFEVALGGKPTAANVALKRTFTRVRSDVYLKGRVATEHFATITAPVLVKIVTSASATSTGRFTVVRRKWAAFATAARALPERKLVREVVGQHALAGLVQHFLGTALQHFQRVGFAGRRRWV